MQITAIETLHVEAYSNLAWVRVHTDAGLVGLGETFRNPKATIAYIHETCAPYLLGKDPHCRGYYTEVVTELPAIRDGHVYPLAGPGLGTELQPGIEARADAHRRVSRLGD